MIFDFFKNQKLKEARQEILDLKQEVDVWQDNFRQAMGLVHYYKGYMKKYEKLNIDYNILLDKLHRNEGGRDCGNSRGNQFSDEDLRRLINLCHPDKHNGKQMAVEITQMLIKMRDQK